LWFVVLVGGPSLQHREFNCKFWPEPGLASDAGSDLERRRLMADG
jgi:hypothetical protein